MSLQHRLALGLLILPFPLACDGGSGGDGDGSTGGTDTATTMTMTDATNTSPATTMTTTPATSTGPTTGDTTTVADDSGSSTAADDSGSDSGSSSTGPTTQEVSIQFSARVGADDANCAGSYSGLGTGGTDATLRDIRFYVSNVRLINDADEEVAVELTQDGVWQYEDVALLDFEDGTAACMMSGDAGLNDVVVGAVPAGTYSGVVFDLGVPEELNHLDASTAEPPLNVLSMAWPWLVGRKFVRIDLRADTGAVDKNGMPVFGAWNIHLGSQGCSNDGAGGMMPPTEACTRPQRPQIALDGFDPDTNTIVADIAALVADNDIRIDQGGAPGCQSFFDPMAKGGNPDCATLFPNYGMDWATGDCTDDCAEQSLFSVE